MIQNNISLTPPLHLYRGASGAYRSFAIEIGWVSICLPALCARGAPDSRIRFNHQLSAADMKIFKSCHGLCWQLSPDR